MSSWRIASKSCSTRTIVIVYMFDRNLSQANCSAAAAASFLLRFFLLGSNSGGISNKNVESLLLASFPATSWKTRLFFHPRQTIHLATVVGDAVCFWFDQTSPVLASSHYLPTVHEPSALGMITHKNGNGLFSRKLLGGLSTLTISVRRQRFAYYKLVCTDHY